MNKIVENYLDKTLVDFFPSTGLWKSNCFIKSKEVSRANLPCHLRDNEWLSKLILSEYNLYSIGKGEILDYVTNSLEFNSKRHEYEQRIVSWQIDWMYHDGSNWICEDDLYVFSNRCDEIFRKGIVDTLLAIGMSYDAIEEGIEHNIDNWLESYMRLAFHNSYSYNIFSGKPTSELPEPTKEHYEKWRKLRLYKYYQKHKESVDKYGKVLPEMLMSLSEVSELENCLAEEDKKMKARIEEFNNNTEFVSPIVASIDFYSCDFPDVKDLESEYVPHIGDKPKSLIKRIFTSRRK
jgi:hypothetical protein